MVNDAPASLRLRSRPGVCVRTSFSLPKFRERRAADVRPSVREVQLDTISKSGGSSSSVTAAM
jgi:hypothetical protein